MFVSKENLATHVLEEHHTENSRGLTPTTIDNSNYSGEKLMELALPAQFKCHQCQKSFVTKRAVMRHWRENHGNVDGIYTHGNVVKERKIGMAEREDAEEVEQEDAAKVEVLKEDLAEVVKEEAAEVEVVK